MRRTLHTAGVGLVLALVAGAAIAGLSSTASGHTHSASVSSVTIRLTGDYDSLDPLKANSTSSAQLFLAAYDSMVYINNEGRVIPYLAKSWTVTPRSVTMRVKTGVKCSDGSTLTPADMAASLRYMIAHVPGHDSGYFGAGPVTVTSSGDTVAIRTKTPFYGILDSLAQNSIFCPAELRNPTPDKMVGSGPYVLTNSQRGSSYTFTLRPSWNWGPVSARHLPKKLIYKVVPNESTAANLLLSGGLDVAQVTGPDTQRLVSNSSVKLHAFRDFGMTFMDFNEAPGQVTADPAVRRALAEAVDRNAWNKAAANGAGHPSHSFMPTNMPCYDPKTASIDPPYNPAAARATLEKAGYTAGAGGTLEKNGKPLAVTVVAWVGDNLGPDYVVAALQKIGVQATLQKTDIGTWATNATAGNFQVLIIPDEVPTPMPTQISGYIMGPTANGNFASINNSVADHWANVATRSVGAAECAAWNKVQSAFAENVDIKPLTSESYSWFSRAGLTFDSNGPDMYPWSINAG